LSLPSGFFPSSFPTRILCTPLPSPIRATCPAHLILLDFTTRTILCKEYRLLKSYSSTLPKGLRGLRKGETYLPKQQTELSYSLRDH
jgi:hypothetical protein